ncbi:MAG: hypothetical protein UF067_08745, partial [Paludibacteraceae bacterium]|nr:hypothetical protein [Paludibacteraceae bacterium]
PIHNMQEAVHMMVDLRETYNIFCVMIIYPYIQQDKVLLRFIPTATHTLEDVDYTVESLAKIYENLKAGKYIDNKPISRPAIEEEQ